RPRAVSRSRAGHLAQLAAPRAELLDVDAHVLLRDVDDDLLVRLERLAVRALARDHARPRDGELVPLAAHRLHQDPQVQLAAPGDRSEEHTSELQSRENLVCRLLLEKKKNKQT